jgi:hypothetical protein
MPKLQDIPLSKTDFDNAAWHDVIETIAEKRCEKYHQVFFQKAVAAQENGNATLEEVFTLLGATSSMWLRPDTKEVFQPSFVFYEPPARGFILDDLSNEQIAVLAEIAPSVPNAEMRARLADVAWVKGKSKYYPLVEVAVQAYVESAKWLLDSSKRLELEANTRLRRALDLANSVRNRQLLDAVLDEIENIIFSREEDDKEFSFAMMLRLLLAYPSQKAPLYTELSKRLAETSEQHVNWMEASNYWQIKSEWDYREQNAENNRNSLIRAAEAHVKVGEIYASATQPNYPAACFQLEQALVILRRIGGMRSTCEEIHSTILKYQQISADNFERASISCDITEFVHKAQQSVKGKPISEAILRLAFAERPADKQDIRERVEEYLATASFHMLFPMTMVDNQGRTTATSPSLLNATNTDKEQIIKARMFMEAGLHHRLVAAAIIEPMVYQISLDHYIQIEDLAFLVRNNPLIPPNHAYIFLKGLYAGFQGDLLVAAHLLIPQIENSLRYILNQHGVITSSLNTETGIQENFTLDTLLELSSLEDILGANIVFDLQTLLIRRFGSNLRNKLSHGLMQTGEFSSEVIEYFWWLVLHLCCYALPKLPNDEAPDEVTDN